MGGLINSSTVKGDLWLIEAGGNMSCYPLATTAEGPGPRVGHASLLVGNAFIVYGGDTKIDESDVLDETLYLLNTCKLPDRRCSFATLRFPVVRGLTVTASYETVVESSPGRRATFWSVRPLPKHNGVQDLHLRWSG